MFMIIIPVVNFIFIVALLCEPTKRRVARSNAMKTKELVEEKFSDRDLQIRLEERVVSDGKPEEYVAIFTIYNPGVSAPGVELPELTDEDKTAIEMLRQGEKLTTSMFIGHPSCVKV